ncbi:hypothetical protein [Streptomyces millisiae]|uniref:Uncharacterized protein n=1 Tax=Streptomyces millisiae TaxID=3075542 RepID=A0ABU2LNW7_9ACTN|nr:hypothetical protein [Streptomyces sp. DSM 44918]MDT0319284.1 hypothetical protein [Streptomyces sp. DSM 44918]
MATTPPVFRTPAAERNAHAIRDGRRALQRLGIVGDLLVLARRGARDA